MVSDKNSNQAAIPPHKGAQSSRITQEHLGAPRLARRAPASREHKAALTLDPEGGEVGAHSCLLGRPTVATKFNYVVNIKVANLSCLYELRIDD